MKLNPNYSLQNYRLDYEPKFNFNKSKLNKFIKLMERMKRKK